jgi:hypothetical protein
VAVCPTLHETIRAGILAMVRELSLVRAWARA